MVNALEEVKTLAENQSRAVLVEALAIELAAKFHSVPHATDALHASRQCIIVATPRTNRLQRIISENRCMTNIGIIAIDSPIVAEVDHELIA